MRSRLLIFGVFRKPGPGLSNIIRVSQKNRTWFIETKYARCSALVRGEMYSSAQLQKPAVGRLIPFYSPRSSRMSRISVSMPIIGPQSVTIALQTRSGLLQL